MDEKVIQDLFDRAVSNGYKKSIEEFKVLINSDQEVFDDMFEYGKSKGYSDNPEAFAVLVGKSQPVEDGKKKAFDPFNQEPPNQKPIMLQGRPTESSSGIGSSVSSLVEDVQSNIGQYATNLEEKKKLDSLRQFEKSTGQETPIAQVQREENLTAPLEQVQQKGAFDIKMADIEAAVPEMAKSGINAIDQNVINKSIESFAETMNYDFPGFAFEKSGSSLKMTAPDGTVEYVNWLKGPEETADNVKYFVKTKSADKDWIDKVTELYKGENQKFQSNIEVEMTLKEFAKEQQGLVDSQNDFIKRKKEAEDNYKAIIDMPLNQRDAQYRDNKYKAEKALEAIGIEGTEIQKKVNDSPKRQKDLEKAIFKYNEKEGKSGSVIGYMWDKLLGAVDWSTSSVISTAIDVKTMLPLNVLLGDDEYNKVFNDKFIAKGFLEKDVTPADVNAINAEIRDEIRKKEKYGSDEEMTWMETSRATLKNTFGSKNTTDQYSAIMDQGFWTGTLGSVVEMAPMLLSPGSYLKMGIGYLQGASYIDREFESDPELSKTSETDKLALKVPLGLITAALDKLGLDEVVKGSGIIKSIAGKILPKATTGMSVTAFNKLAQSEIAKMINTGVFRVFDGALVEGITGSLEEVASISGKELFNMAKGKDLFETPNALIDFLGQVGWAGVQEGAAGVMATAPFAVAEAFSKNNIAGIPKEYFNVFVQSANDPIIEKSFITSLKNKVSAGEIKKSDAVELLNNYRHSVGLIRSIPEEIGDNDGKQKAMELLRQRKALEAKKEGKDNALAKPINDRIAAINEQLSKLTEDAIQKQTAGQVPVQPEAGVGEAVVEGEPKTGLEGPTQETIIKENKRGEALATAIAQTEGDVLMVDGVEISRADAEKEVQNISEKKTTEAAPKKMAPVDVFKAAPVESKKDIVIATENGDVALEGNEGTAAKLYEEAQAIPEEQRTPEQVKLIEQLEPIVIDQESNAILKMDEEVDGEAMPDNAAEPFTEQDAMRRTELESSLAAVDKNKRRDIKVGTQRMTRADIKAEIDAINQKETASKLVEPSNNRVRLTSGAESTSKEAIAKRLRGKKSKGLMSSIDFGITRALYNGALEFMAKQVEKGTKLGNAITDTIKWIDEKMQGKNWDKDGFTKYANTTFEEVVTKKKAKDILDVYPKGSIAADMEPTSKKARMSKFTDGDIDETNANGILQMLSDKFSIPFETINDPEQGYSGKFEDGRVYVNLAHVTPETAWHEFAHPFIEQVKEDNPKLYKSLANEIQTSTYGKQVLAEVKELYPELNEEGQIEEAIVETIARLVTGKVSKTELKKNKAFFQKVLDFVQSIKDALAKMLGVDSVNIADLNNNFTLKHIAEIMQYGGRINLKEYSPIINKNKSKEVRYYINGKRLVGEQKSIADEFSNLVDYIKKPNNDRLLQFSSFLKLKYLLEKDLSFLPKEIIEKYEKIIDDVLVIFPNKNEERTKEKLKADKIFYKSKLDEIISLYPKLQIEKKSKDLPSIQFKNQWTVKDFKSAYHNIGAYMNNAGISSINDAINNFINLLSIGSRIEVASYSSESALETIDGTIRLKFKQETPVIRSYLTDVQSSLIDKNGKLERITEKGNLQLRTDIDEEIKTSMFSSYDELFINATKNNIEQINILKDLSDAEFNSLKELSDLTGAPIIKDGKVVYQPTTVKNYKGQAVKYSKFTNTNKEAEKIVSTGRANGFSDKAIEAALKKKGFTPEEIAKVMGTEAKGKVELSEATLPGYDKLMSRINDVFDRSMRRGSTKEKALENVINNIEKTPEYAAATDQQREQLIRDIRAMFGKKEKAAPSAAKITGKPKPKTVTVKESTALKDQLRLEARAAREAKGDLNAKRKMMNKVIKDMEKGGKITTAQAETLIKKMNNLNLDNPDMVWRFINYAEKVFNDAEYGIKLSAANKLQAEIKKLSKNKTKFGNLTPFAAKFATIDPSMVDDIDTYIENATAVKEGVAGSKVTASGLRVASAVDVDGMMGYVDKAIENQDEAIRLRTAEKIEELLGIDVKDLKYEDMLQLIDPNNPDAKIEAYKETIIRSTINKLFNTYSSIIDSMFETGVDSFTGNPVTFSKSEMELVKSFMDMDLSKMDTKDAIRAADALNNFIVNKSTANMANVLARYTGSANADIVDSKGVKPKPLKMWFSKAFGRNFYQLISSVPLLFEKAFNGASRGAYVMKMMGVTSLINHKAEAQRMVTDTINEYAAMFAGKKPNGKSFQSAYNVIERGIVADLSKTIIGTDKQIQSEFNRRKLLIQESVEILRSGGTKKETEMANTVEEIYNKIVRDSENISEVKAKVNDAGSKITKARDGKKIKIEALARSMSMTTDQLLEIENNKRAPSYHEQIALEKLLDMEIKESVNIEAVQFWIDKWESLYDKFSDVALNVYNRKLIKSVDYTPDRFAFLATSEPKPKDLDDTESSFLANSNYEVLYKTESGSLKEPNPPKGLEGGNMYVNLSFDTNNANAMLEALIDINTAADIRQIQTFKDSDGFKRMFSGNGEDMKLFKERIDLLVKNIRGKRIVVDKAFGNFTKALDKAASYGASMALAGPTQPLKQSLPVMMNTMINTGSIRGFNISMAMNSDVINFVNNSGMPIANRGIDAISELESLSKKLETETGTRSGAVLRAIEKQNERYLKWFLANTDIVVARASWISYYEQSLRNQGIKGKVDYSNHEINQKAAEYAQQMVDRQQNISDKDLAGSMYSSGNPAKQLLVKIFLPFATFRLNQTTRMMNDFSIVTSKTASKEDKAVAGKSLSGLLVEMTTFRALSLGIGWTMYLAAQAIMGDEEDDEAQEKKWKNMVKGAFSSAVSDILSPIPPTDDLVKSIFNTLLDQAQSMADMGDEEKYSIFTETQESYSKMYGMVGIVADKAYGLFQDIQLARTGKYKDDFGNEKIISESDREMLSLMLVPYIMTDLAILPGAPEMSSIMRNLVKIMKSNSETQTRINKNKAYGGYDTIEKLKEGDPKLYDKLSKKGGALYNLRESQKKGSGESNALFRGMTEEGFRKKFPKEWREQYGPGTEYRQYVQSPQGRADRIEKAKEDREDKMEKAKKDREESIRKAREKYN